MAGVTFRKPDHKQLRELRDDFSCKSQFCSFRRLTTFTSFYYGPAKCASTGLMSTLVFLVLEKVLPGPYKEVKLGGTVTKMCVDKGAPNVNSLLLQP